MNASTLAERERAISQRRSTSGQAVTGQAGRRGRAQSCSVKGFDVDGLRRLRRSGVDRRFRRRQASLSGIHHGHETRIVAQGIDVGIGLDVGQEGG
jgi:hypothetical protein